MSSVEWATRVAKEFNFGREDVHNATLRFVKQMEDGLEDDNATMCQIPSYVTTLPNGTEQGLSLAVDLGGTNLRVCAIDLHGDTTYSIKQSKIAIPAELMVATTFDQLFSFIATQLHLFLLTHHPKCLEDHALQTKSEEENEDRRLVLGFTFSFTFEQTAINRGTLLRWTKGFNIPDAVGQDICSVFQAEIDKRGLPVTVTALVNDTVGTLLARSYISPGETTTLLGAIFGTGTNGAYVERVQNIVKLGSSRGSAHKMIVNTEWGSFDNELMVLPSTVYDKIVDRESVHPGIQMFEKRISGLYLGEILRHVILALCTRTTNNSADSKLCQQFAIDASFLSMAASDTTPSLVVLRKELEAHLDLKMDVESATAVRILALAIGKRAARLAGVAVAGVILKSECLSSPTGGNKWASSVKIPVNKHATRAPFINFFSRVMSLFQDWSRWFFPLAWRSENNHLQGIIDVGVDGSLIEYYPGFEEILRSTLRDVDAIGVKGERRIRIGIAKDGSGVGAALAARMAKKD